MKHLCIPENICGSVANLTACESGACPLLLHFQTFLGKESTLLLPFRFFMLFILFLILFLLLPLQRLYFLIFLLCTQWPGDIHVIPLDNVIQNIVDYLVRTIYLRTDYVPVWLLWVLFLLFTVLPRLFYLLLLSFLSFFCLLSPLICLHFLFIMFLGCLIFLFLLFLPPRCL